MNRKKFLPQIFYIVIIFMMLFLSACSMNTENTIKSGAKHTETDTMENSGKTPISNTPEHASVLQETIDGETGNYQPYYIRVNRETNCVTAYQLNETTLQYTAIKSMICSVGRQGNTPCGSFPLQERYEWRELFGNVYGQYAVRIINSILFHSVPYYTDRQDTLKTEEFDKLGTAASEGCIRLQVADAKWIYDNCTEGTVVTIFDGTTEDDPLPRPEAPTLSGSDYPSWDPSDPIAANPWNGGSGNLYEENRSVLQISYLLFPPEKVYYQKTILRQKWQKPVFAAADHMGKSAGKGKNYL